MLFENENAHKCVFGRGSTLDPGEELTALPRTLATLRGGKMGETGEREKGQRGERMSGRREEARGGNGFVRAFKIH